MKIKVSISQCLSCTDVEIEVPENYTHKEVEDTIRSQIITPYELALDNTEDDIFWSEDSFAWIIQND